ncbi:hypothetical protein AGMMS4957_01000 [Bacteroidia bacterium]|nr:hypothetical protein AGMMS4957_01000 [Bacteroidia bacterium]
MDMKTEKNTDAIGQVSEQSWWKWVFIAIVAIIFVAMPLMSLDAGNSRDEEPWRVPQSLLLYEYYTSSFGKSTTGYVVNPQGYAFDTFTTFITQTFGIDDYMTARHVCNAFAGAFLMLFVGLLAWLIGGWRAGSLALLLIFFSPHIVGHSFNNSKDLPFAACIVGAIYYIAWFIKEFPKPTVKTVFKLGVMTGAAIGIRPGGFLLIPYFGLFVLVHYLTINPPKQYFSKENRIILKKIFVQAAVALGIMLVVMFVLWSFALQDPLNNIAASLKGVFHYQGSFSQVFEGKLLYSEDLPWYYIIKNICISSPVAVLIGGGGTTIYGAAATERLLLDIRAAVLFCLSHFLDCVHQSHRLRRLATRDVCLPYTAGSSGIGF